MRSSMPSVQAPAAVVMVRPQHFHPNPQTAADNAFQRSEAGRTAAELATAAHAETTQAATTLRAHGVRVHLFDDDGARNTPDSVFPNNWFSTHPGGHVALYPMHSPNRRRERRADIIEMLKTDYRVQDVIDYSGLEPDGVFLEGTGAMVLDHVMRVAYTARSNRADAVALERFCTHFNFEPMAFDTADAAGQPIYHTNVMMCIATEFALVGFDLISDPRRRAACAAGGIGARRDCARRVADRRICRQRAGADRRAGAAAGAVGTGSGQPAALAAQGHRPIGHACSAAGAHHRARRWFGALHAGGHPPGAALSAGAWRLPAERRPWNRHRPPQRRQSSP